jgi:mRNA interferase RelE/StbE
MSYRLLIYPSAQKSLDAIPMPVHQTIRGAILGLQNDARPRCCAKLTDRPAWRIRIGRYRVIYEVDDANQIVTVIDVGHRRDIYRR